MNDEKQFDNEIREARALGLSGTPGFAIAKVDSTGMAHIKKLVIGAQPLPVFQKVLDDVLSQ